MRVQALSVTSTLFAVLAAALALSARATEFVGVGTGAIPDGVNVTGPCGTGTTSTPLDITFAVTDIAVPIHAIELDVDMTHSWLGDLTLQLVAPNGSLHTIFRSTGATTSPVSCGDGSNLAGTYRFADHQAPNWWAAAASLGDGQTLPPAGYLTTTGPGTPISGATNSLTRAFAGLAAANGTWTLRANDRGAGDTGSITRAALRLLRRGEFVASSNGAIPDAQGALSGCANATTLTPLNLPIVVSGVATPLTSVQVSLRISHNWIGDLRTQLIAPNGSSAFPFSRVGASQPTACGDNSDLGGTYLFGDNLPGNLWTTAAQTAATAAIPSGAYFASSAGGTNGAIGQAINFTAAFTTLAPNSIWTLRFTDLSVSETGTVSQASIILLPTDRVFASSID